MKKRFVKNSQKLNKNLNTLAQQILLSEQRNFISCVSVNGFNQKSVDKYCKNNYKIFSLYTEGNITPEVWVYRDKRGNI